MPTAIVTGATGILGSEIVRTLGNDSSTWTKIYALSRSQKEEYPHNVKHDFIDLTSEAQEMAKQLEGVEADYLFFAAYLQKDDEQEMWDVNGAMLRNFLEALEITGAAKKLKRVVLTTGVKQYAVHLGQVKCPMEETDRWVEGPGRPPNFYYNQQRILAEYCKKNTYDWVVTYPNDVIGVAKGNFMNLVTSLGLYCAVSKELSGELIFPGSEEFYSRFDSFTSAKLHASFNLWAVTNSKCSNQAFNIVNGESESWQNMWPKLAKRFGCKVPEDQFRQSTRFESSEAPLADSPPIADVAGDIGLKGSAFNNKLVQKIDLTKWSQDKQVLEAWKKVQEREGLQKDAFEKATWFFLGFVLGRNYDIVVSMAKARKYGWTGYVDTFEAFEDCFSELESLKVLPKA